MAVWLLAARFAKDYELSHRSATAIELGLSSEPYQGWPDFFMAPENRCREPSMFLGGYVAKCERHSLSAANFTAVTGPDPVDYDRRVLKNWFEYARARLPALERRLMVWLLLDSLPETQARIRRAL